MKTVPSPNEVTPCVYRLYAIHAFRMTLVVINMSTPDRVPFFSACTFSEMTFQKPFL